MSLSENFKTLQSKVGSLSVELKTIKSCSEARSHLLEVKKLCDSLRKQTLDHGKSMKKPRKVAFKPKLDIIEEVLEVAESLDTDETDDSEELVIETKDHTYSDSEPEELPEAPLVLVRQNAVEPELVPAVEHPVKSPRPDFMEPQPTPKPKRVRKVQAF